MALRRISLSEIHIGGNFVPLVKRIVRILTVIVGAVVLLIALTIMGLALQCDSGPGCLATEDFLGLPAVGWGVVLLFVGLTLIAGCAWAYAPV
jgi:hypothetical protein